MMSRLARSQQICIAETSPFEVRLISYWATVSRTLTGAADYDNSMHPDKLEGDGLKVGANPFSSQTFMAAFRSKSLGTTYFGDFTRQKLGDTARHLIVEYYNRLAYDQKKKDFSFFAEKNNNLHRPTRNFARELFPELREIVLIRDPRDLLCSQRSYFRSEPVAAFRGITGSTQELMRIANEEASCVTFVKYEDMVMDDIAVSQWLFPKLGINEAGHRQDRDEQSIFEVHGTSRSPAASIGRWRSDLTSEQQQTCTKIWGDFLDRFNYE
jgi:hypothetical protein